MTTSPRGLAIRRRVATTLAAVFGALAVVTALSPTWIESITGLEPDAESGSAEWGIVAAFAVAAVLAAALAVHDYRSPRRSSANS
jgi:hypothetical protein